MYNVVEYYKEKLSDKDNPGYIEDQEIVEAMGDDLGYMRQFGMNQWIILRIAYEKNFFHENKELCIYPINKRGDTSFQQPLRTRNVAYYDAIKMMKEGSLTSIADLSRDYLVNN